MRGPLLKRYEKGRRNNYYVATIIWNSQVGLTELLGLIELLGLTELIGLIELGANRPNRLIELKDLVELIGLMN